MKIAEYLQRAIKQALKMLKAAGNPIAVWKDRKVVLIAPEDIKVWISSKDYDGLKDNPLILVKSLNPDSEKENE